MYNNSEIENCIDTLKRELNIITQSEEHRGLILDAVAIIEQLKASSKDNLVKYVDLRQDYVNFVKEQNDKLSAIIEQKRRNF